MAQYKHLDFYNISEIFTTYYIVFYCVVCPGIFLC